MGHFFSKVSLFIDKKEAAAHLILDQDFATAPFKFVINLDYKNKQTYLFRGIITNGQILKGNLLFYLWQKKVSTH